MGKEVSGRRTSQLVTTFKSFDCNFQQEVKKMRLICQHCSHHCELRAPGLPVCRHWDFLPTGRTKEGGWSLAGLKTKVGSGFSSYGVIISS